MNEVYNFIEDICISFKLDINKLFSSVKNTKKKPNIK